MRPSDLTSLNSPLPTDVERLAILGWRLFPGAAASRHFARSGIHREATTRLDRLEAWARGFPGCQWRVLMQGSGIWALDLDAPSEQHAANGLAAFRRLRQSERGGALPPVPWLRSGGGGACLFFRFSGEAISGRTGWPEPGIDPRRGMLSVTVPPSLHHRTRQPYRWIVAPWELNPPDAPTWLLKLVAPPPEAEWQGSAFSGAVSEERALRRLVSAVDAVLRAREGHRNATLNANAFYVARYVYAGRLDYGRARDELYKAARQSGLDARECLGTLDSAFRAAARAPAGPEE